MNDPYTMSERIAIKMDSGMTEREAKNSTLLEDNQRRIMELSKRPKPPKAIRVPHIPPMLDRKSMAAGEHGE